MTWHTRAQKRKARMGKWRKIFLWVPREVDDTNEESKQMAWLQFVWYNEIPANHVCPNGRVYNYSTPWWRTNAHHVKCLLTETKK